MFRSCTTPHDVNLASWYFTAPAGDYDIRVNIALGDTWAGGTYSVSIGGTEINGTTAGTGGPNNSADQIVGRVHLSGGKQMLSIKPLKFAREGLLDLHAITLTTARAE